MKQNRNAIATILCLFFLWFGFANSSYSMGLRSFVALPVEKEGGVVRLSIEHAEEADTDILTTSAAYGFSAKQTLLLGLPYRLSPAGDNRQGDVSALYRHIVWQEDSPSGTDRLGFLGGAIIPTKNDRDAAIQAGFVFTHFKNRNEIDIDALYQEGMGNRDNSGRYDISWQYRLSPVERIDWGIEREVNSVLELNGRWNQGNNITHQLTAGLQWIHQKIVIEGGIVKDLNSANETRYISSTRFHF
jgi:hypothetical protein